MSLRGVTSGLPGLGHDRVTSDKFRAMNSKLFRLSVALAAILAVLGASALVAGSSLGQPYCDPLGGCHFVSVSPRTVKAGHSITVSGAVGGGCKKPARVTIYSRAFRGATRHRFAGVPAIFTTTNRTGNFSKRVTIRKTIKPGAYRVGARCGGGKFGSTTLRVVKR